jgi:hypothetical protein
LCQVPEAQPEAGHDAGPLVLPEVSRRKCRPVIAL